MSPQRSKSQTPLVAFKNRVRGDLNHVFHAIAEARPRLPIAEYPNAITWLKSTPAGNVFFQSAFPTSLEAMKLAPVLPKINLLNELAWSASLLQMHAERLRSFLELRKSYELFLLASDYAACLNVLRDIETCCGPSLFVIEQRIALLQRASGLKAQKSYTEAVIAVRPDNDVVAFFASFASQRNEENTTAGRFTSRIRKILGGWSLSEDYLAYLEFRLFARMPTRPDQLAGILRHEQNSAAVDLYESTLSVLIQLIIKSDAPTATAAMRYIAALARVFRDDRLERALSLSDGRVPQSASDIVALSALLRGDWKEASHLARSDLALFGSRTSWQVDAIASTLGQLPLREDKTVDGSIVRSFASIIRRGDDFEDRVDRLYKLLINHSTCGFSSDINYAAAAELINDVPSPLNNDVLAAFIHTSRPTISHTLDALVGLPIDGEGDDFLLVANYVRAMRGEPSDLPLLRRLATPAFASLASATANSADGQFEQSLADAKELLQSFSYFRRHGAKIAAHCLLQLDRLGEAADIVVQQVLNEPKAIRNLPLADVALPLKDKFKRRKVAGKLSTSIVLDLFTRQVDDTLQKVRGYAFDEFLRAKGVKRPADLGPMLQDLDRDQALYYLRHICVAQNMQTSPLFTSVNDVENARIDICYLLAEIDPENRDDYIQEAVAIARDQIIREAMHKAELSKVYVDESALHSWAKRDLQESFARYKALSRISRTEEQLLQRLRVVLAETDAGKSLRIFKYPTHESVAVLNDTIDDVVKEALTSAEFGLDSYLGTRIRHGTLSAQLRSALVDHKLITQKRATDAPYSNNDYWWGKFSNDPRSARESVSTSLNAFSREFDTLVDRFAKEQIQIKSAEKPQGLFAASLSADAITRIIGVVGVEDASFERFIDLCLDATLEEAEVSLQRVRDVIDNELKPAVDAMLTALEQDVSGKVADHSDFDWAVRNARTETIHLLEHVKGWFCLTRSTVEPTLSLDQLVETSVRTVATLHRDFKPRLSKHLPDVLFGNALTRFTSDIFFQLLENVWQYSQCAEPAILVDASYDDGRLRLRVESDIGPHVQTSDAERELAKIREDLANAGYQQATRTEGKSGLKKVFRSINQAQTRKPHMTFDFVDRSKFIVELEFDIPLAKETDQ